MCQRFDKGDLVLRKVDGKLIGEQPENFKLPKFQKVSVYIGAGENPNVHKMEGGIIDDVAIYDTALTADEINRVMTDGVLGALAVESKNKLAVTWGGVKSTF